MPCLVRLSLISFFNDSFGHNKLCRFISHIVMSMDNFLAGEDQQQTNQPDDQAGS